jgi:hypothetical protein
MANKWQLLSRAIVGDREKAHALAVQSPAPLVQIDRAPVKRLVSDASAAAQAGLRDMLVSAGQRVIESTSAAPVRRTRRNSGFAAAAQSAAWKASAAAAAEAADASFAAEAATLAQRRAEESAAAVALLPSVSRRLARRVAPFMPGASVDPTSPRSYPKFRFLRQQDVPPENGAAYMRSIIKQHEKVLTRLRNGGQPRSVVLQAELEERQRQRQMSPRAMLRDSTHTLHAVADFLHSVGVAPPLPSTASGDLEHSPTASIAGFASAPYDSRASIGSPVGGPIASRALPPRDLSPSKQSVGGASSLLASREEWERRVRNGANPSQIEPKHAAESIQSFTLHLPRALHSENSMGDASVVSTTAAEAYMSLKDLQASSTDSYTACTPMNWAYLV